MKEQTNEQSFLFIQKLMFKICTYMDGYILIYKQI